ncbi:hypothetical protein P354_15225 [Streptomyces noursei PD-1]|uniref:Agarase n=1 Tax=Streptomyces noursei TaxID=1971 RepID=A0A401RA27_STRNR|nr:hypothetical protein P354_15225 [Streptomyces noursei PD-1]GCB94437.1 agarase [Streptomyces noursei]
MEGAPIDLGHSEGLPPEELAGAGIPYTLSLRAVEIEYWNGFPAYRDPREPAFAQWCDHLARTVCRPDDPNLLGYFLVDAPCWNRHPAGAGYPASELPAIAEAYYRITTEAIRRHDPNHLILGDRYGTRAGVPEVVLDAMAPHVDVLSVQTFPGPDPASLDAALEQIGRWHERTNRPVLIADTGNWCPTVMSPERTGSARDQRERGAGYTASAEAFAARPWCLGWHWCGWLENPQRGFGLKDPWDEPYRDLTDQVTETNRHLQEQVNHDESDRTAPSTPSDDHAASGPTMSVLARRVLLRGPMRRRLVPPGPGPLRPAVQLGRVVRGPLGSAVSAAKTGTVSLSVSVACCSRRTRRWRSGEGDVATVHLLLLAVGLRVLVACGVNVSALRGKGPGRWFGVGRRGCGPGLWMRGEGAVVWGRLPGASGRARC